MDVDIDIDDELFEKAMLFVPSSTSVNQVIEMALTAFIESRMARQRPEAEAATERDE